MAADNAPMKDALRATRIFSAILVVGGLGGCIAGTATNDMTPTVLGAIAAACGVLLAVLTLLAGRKSKP